MAERPLVVVGGGLVGPVAAMFLARRFGRVELYERRPPPSEVAFDKGRSVHVVLSVRGWSVLEELGVAAKVRQGAMPLRGRHVHVEDGQVVFQPYSRRGDTIWAVERPRLNAILLACAEATPGLSVHYGHTAVAADPEAPSVRFARRDRSQVSVEAALVVACDGIHSAVREAIGGTEDIELLPLGYKEIRFPAKEPGAWSLDPGCFHTWPRPGVLVTAFPNPDGSLTGSVFLPRDGAVDSFAATQTEEEARALLARGHSAVLEVATDAPAQLAHHPLGVLSTLHVGRWTRGGLVLAGDAAHAIVPFMGQGMNCGFEDARTLDRCLFEHGVGPAALEAYAALRKPEADAIAAISLAHWNHLAAPLPPGHPRTRIADRLFGIAPERFVPTYERCAFSLASYAEAWRAEREVEKVVSAFEHEAETWLALEVEDALARVERVLA
jgi:kynurenine 3-monooxygenase